MRMFTEKSIITALCLYATYAFLEGVDLVALFLLSLLLSVALDLSVNKKYRYVFYILFILLVLYHPAFIFYLPLIFYNLYLDFKYLSLLSLLLLFINFPPMVLIISFLSLYFSYSTDKVETMVIQHRTLRDDLREDTLMLKKYNEQQTLDREKNIHIAILTERNRIAREIHDSIGHAISSSILQVQALKVISDDEAKEPLDQLQNTLNDGMNDIRKSLQGLRDESLDLKARIESLIDDIPHMAVEFIYHLDEDMDYNLKFDVLSIVKEAITNTVKHSDATSLKISLLAQPKFYNLIIVDNGTIKPLFEHKGIGLDYITETANKYDGHFNYNYEKGFKMHITLMKGN